MCSSAAAGLQGSTCFSEILFSTPWLWPVVISSKLLPYCHLKPVCQFPSDLYQPCGFFFFFSKKLYLTRLLSGRRWWWCCENPTQTSSPATLFTKFKVTYISRLPLTDGAFNFSMSSAPA